MDSILGWGVVASSGLTFVIGLIFGFIGFLIGRRRARAKRLAEKAEARQQYERLMCSRLSPIVRLTRLGLKVESLKLGCDLDCRCHSTFGGGRIAVYQGIELLGGFCVWCGHGIPRHEDGAYKPTLYELLHNLEQQAAMDGTYILPDPVKQPWSPNFVTAVEGTGSLRQPPMRVRVDTVNRTVWPVEDPSAELTEDEARELVASEVARKVFPS